MTLLPADDHQINSSHGAGAIHSGLFFALLSVAELANSRGNYWDRAGTCAEFDGKWARYHNIYLTTVSSVLLTFWFCGAGLAMCVAAVADSVLLMGPAGLRVWGSDG